MSAMADTILTFDSFGNHGDLVAASTSRTEDRAAGITASRHSRESALALDDINLSFGGVTALSHVSLHIHKGEIRSIIGPNGAGKSSLVNVICGVYRPDTGRVWIDGDRFDQVPTRRLAELGIARTFQNLALFKGLTVRDNVASGLSFRNRSNVLSQILGLPSARRQHRDAQQQADDIIKFLHLDAVADRLASTLPYGLQKRVELARALVARPKLLLLDEPMAGTTGTEKQEMAQFIRAVRDTFDTTIILIEHDIGLVMELSDRVAVLDYGRKIADGTPDQVRNDQAVIDAYLGVPHDNESGGGI